MELGKSTAHPKETIPRLKRMNEEEIQALKEVKDEIKGFRRRYMVLWGGIFLVAIILRALGRW